MKQLEDEHFDKIQNVEYKENSLDSTCYKGLDDKQDIPDVIPVDKGMICDIQQMCQQSSAANRYKEIVSICIC